ncbi:MAG TPA: DUF2306 domain-containing protein [Cellvibrio sp.]|nr:DUF2306 domain-containing protein [Cellvibrio sp.]
METLNNTRIYPAAFNSLGLLKASGLLWFAMVLVGQWAFFYYIAAFYGGSVISGNLDVWNRFEVFGVKPYVPEDSSGNFTFGAHAIAAGLVAFGGALQLIPQLRRWAPRFHHWNGRVFLFTVVALSLSGLYLVWFRNSPPKDFAGLHSTINGLLILLFSYFALSQAIARKIEQHQRWALRLYLVAIANWTQRVGVMSYMTLGNTLALDPTFKDPFFTFWKFGCYLVPLAVLELYFFASNSKSAIFRISTAALVISLTLVMVVGTIAYSMFTHLLITGAPLPL